MDRNLLWIILFNQRKERTPAKRLAGDLSTDSFLFLAFLFFVLSAAEGFAFFATNHLKG